MEFVWYGLTFYGKLKSFKNLPSLFRQYRNIMILKKDLSSKHFTLVFFGILLIAIIIVYKQVFWHIAPSHKYEKKISNALNSLYMNRDTLSTFRLDSIMDFAWEKVIYVESYLPQAQTSRGCKIDFSVLQNSNLRYSDGISGLLFLDNTNKAVKYVEFDSIVPRGLPEMNEKYPCGTKKSKAIFKVKIWNTEETFRIELLIT